MSEVAEAKVKPKARRADREPDCSPAPPARMTPPRRERRVAPVLLTVLVMAVAVLLERAMWDAYMGAPWTRDRTVRAYVVTMAPEVTGRIVELPVVDNEYVHKGDLLMVIDPTDYAIGVSQAEAAVQQAEAGVQTIDAQIAVQQAQISADQAQVDRAQTAFVFAQQQAAATGSSRKTAGAPFRMPSSIRRSCASRRRRCGQQWKTSTSRSDKSPRWRRST